MWAFLLSFQRAEWNSIRVIAAESTMLSLILTVHNEGDELSRALKSVLSKTTEASNVLIVDDASTDGCCERVENDRVHVIRNASRKGVAASRHQAVQAAQGSVLAFLDGHHRVATGALNCCAELAASHPSIVVPDIRDFELDSPTTHGASFRMCPERGYFSANWNYAHPQQQISRVTSLRSPIYLMSRETYDRVYWIQGLRNWGGSEAAISVKAFFLDIPILHLCGTPTRHMFNQKLEYNATWDDVWRNHALIARVCFDARTWYKYWLPKLFEPHLTDEAKRDMESESIVAQHEEFQRVKVRTDAEFWTVLLNQPVPPELA
jgi:glycosyltransferase involved in cell wall biosynthesis